MNIYIKYISGEHSANPYTSMGSCLNRTWIWTTIPRMSIRYASIAPHGYICVYQDGQPACPYTRFWLCHVTLPWEDVRICYGAGRETWTPNLIITNDLRYRCAIPATILRLRDFEFFNPSAKFINDSRTTNVLTIILQFMKSNFQCRNLIIIRHYIFPFLSQNR